jgi:biopolymer transport protein ExbB
MNGNLGFLSFLVSSGGDWVIFILILCSVLTLAVIVERWIVVRRESLYARQLMENIPDLLANRQWEKSLADTLKIPGAGAAILAAALKNHKAHPGAVEEYAAAERLIQKKNLEKRLLILGTLGNNAPFIGLFGTVLGVIKAFRDLSESAAAGPEVVMQGLSEALIATAVGLLVAIPAVMAFNYLQKRVNDVLTDSEVLVKLVVAALKDDARKS